jgi:hypothetical protein
MTKGKDTYTTELELKYDPTSLLTETERKQKNEATMKLYNLTEELAYMVYEIDSYIEKGEGVIKQNSKSQKIIQPVVDELNTLKKTLVITTGDNYTDTAEPQLREDLVDLYAKLASSFDKPSPAELENMQLILERYDEAVKKFVTVKEKQVGKMIQYLEKNQIEPVSIKPFSDFK